MMTRIVSLPSFAFAFVVVTAAPLLARADESSASYFQNGQKLMKEKRYAEACPEFEKALALNPGAGTKFNLADCYEKTNRPATALTLFREVESVTRQVAQRERSAAAKERADALEPRVPTVIVRAAWASSQQQVALYLDGKPLPLTSLEQPIKVDLGKHEAIARLGTNEKKAEAIIDAEKQSLPIVLESPAPRAATPTEAQPTSNALASEPSHVETRSGGTQRTVGLVIGGVGIVAAAVGTVVMLSGKSNYDDARSEGTCKGNVCHAETARKMTGYRDDVNVGGAVMTIGAAALAAGIVVWLTAPKSTESRALLSPSKNGMTAVFRF